MPDPDVAPLVVACVVTHHPGAQLAQHLAALRPQVDALVVVDNGSDHPQDIAQVARLQGCAFVGNATNLGIAAALNQAVRYAQGLNARWLGMFDQDSLVGGDMVPGLLRFAQAHPAGDRIGVLAASHRDRATQTHYHHPWDILDETPTARSLRSTITSGSLARLEVFADVGLFDESLFIDSVDHDFCLRARRHGWQVVESRSQVIEHSIGSITVERLMGLRVVCTHHSAQRRYYMTRNQLEVSWRYVMFDPRWSFKGLLILGGGWLAVVFYERNKVAKCAAMLQGAAHFVRRRFGRRP